MTDTVPGPRGWDAFRTVKAIGVDPFGTLSADIAKYGEVVRYPMGLVVVYFIHHPDHVQQILERNHTNYRRSPFYARMKPLLGEGLITSDGELYKRQRRLVQKGFTRPLLQSYARSIVTECERATKRIEARIGGDAFDVCHDNVRLSLSIAGQVMFHADLSSGLDVIETALPPALDEIDARFNEMWVTPEWIPTPRNRRLRKSVDALDALVNDLLAQRRKTGERHDDILDLLVDAARDPANQLPDRQIRDEVMTLLLAGHETTANLLSWTYSLLMANPGAEDRLVQEINTTCRGDLPTFENLAQMPYLQRVLCESLRLYPPAWSMDRQVIADDTIGGHTIPAGSVVFFPPYFVHRHREFWPDAEKFDPERFNEETAGKRHKYAFVPFGGGPRLCVGRDLAMMSAGLALATMLPKVKLTLEPGHPVAMHPAITLRPRHGLKVRASRR